MLFRSILAAFLAANPSVDVDLDERPSPEVARAVAEGLAEIGIAADHADFSGLVAMPFRTDRLMLVVPRGHKLASRGRVAFVEALGSEFVASQATARSAGIWRSMPRGRARWCERAYGCAGWMQPAAWSRLAPASPWSPKPRRGGGRERERSASCSWRTPGPNAV